MKITNLIRTAALIVAVVLFFLPDANAQRGGHVDQNQTLYWFNVKVSKTTNRNSGLEEYQERVISPTIYHGGVKKYQKELWNGTVAGTKVAVGPFESYEQATNALKIYKMVKDTTTARPNLGTCYWFLVKIEIMERSHAYQFERMAAAVAAGSSTEFSDVLRESLGFKTLAIGPFMNQEAAERAKALYRIEE